MQFIQGRTIKERRALRLCKLGKKTDLRYGS